MQQADRADSTRRPNSSSGKAGTFSPQITFIVDLPLDMVQPPIEATFCGLSNVEALLQAITDKSEDGVVGAERMLASALPQIAESYFRQISALAQIAREEVDRMQGLTHAVDDMTHRHSRRGRGA